MIATASMTIGEIIKMFMRLITCWQSTSSQWKCLDQRRDPDIDIAKLKQLRDVYKQKSGDHTELMHLQQLIIHSDGHNLKSKFTSQNKLGPKSWYPLQ